MYHLHFYKVYDTKEGDTASIEIIDRFLFISYKCFSIKNEITMKDNQNLYNLSPVESAQILIRSFGL